MIKKARSPTVDSRVWQTISDGDEAVILVRLTDPGFLDLDDFTFGSRVKTMALQPHKLLRERRRKICLLLASEWRSAYIVSQNGDITSI